MCIRVYHDMTLINIQAKDFVTAKAKKDKTTAEMTTSLLNCYKTWLIKNDHYGHYFARTENKGDSFCDSEVEQSLQYLP